MFLSSWKWRVCLRETQTASNDSGFDFPLTTLLFAPTFSALPEPLHFVIQCYTKPTLTFITPRWNLQFWKCWGEIVEPGGHLCDVFIIVIISVRSLVLLFDRLQNNVLCYISVTFKITANNVLETYRIQTATAPLADKITWWTE